MYVCRVASKWHISAGIMPHFSFGYAWPVVVNLGWYYLPVDQSSGFVSLSQTEYRETWQEKCDQLKKKGHTKLWPKLRIWVWELSGLGSFACQSEGYWSELCFLMQDQAVTLGAHQEGPEHVCADQECVEPQPRVCTGRVTGKCTVGKLHTYNASLGYSGNSFCEPWFWIKLIGNVLFPIGF